MRNKYKKALIVASTAIFTFSQCPMHVWAKENEVTKEENVFAILEGNGEVKDITVSDWLNSSNGFDDYFDTSCLENVVNLKGNEAIEAKEGGYLWNSEKNDVYYQGTSTKELPFDLAITYRLDDKEMNLDELLGKSGHLSMNIKVMPKTSEMINGRQLYVPLAVATIVDLDSSHFSNVEVDHGLMKTDDKNQMICSIFFPGLLENYDGILDNYLAELKNDISQEVTINCEVTDFTIPQIMGGAASTLEELTKMSISDDFSGVLSSLDALKEATQQLVSGTDALKEAATTFDTKLDEMNTQFSSYQTGVQTAYQGTKDLHDGMAKLNGAMQLLKNELDSEMLPGLAASQEKQQALQTQMVSLQQKLNELGLDNMDETITQLQTELVSALTTMYQAGLDTGIAVATANQYQNIDAYLTALYQENPTQAQMVQDMVDQSSEMARQTATDHLSEILGQLPLAQLSDMQNDLKSLTDLASSMMSDLNGLLGKVYDENDSLDNPQTLYGSILALSVGVHQVDSGSQTLLDGMDALNQASQAISKALSLFKDGSSSLKEGTETLNDGMKQYASEGISQLTDNSALNELEAAINIQQDMQEIALTNYSGASTGTKSSVHYIFKVDDSIEKKIEEKEVTEQEKTTLWDRFIGLFS